MPLRGLGLVAWMMIGLSSFSCSASPEGEADVDLCRLDAEPQPAASAVTEADVYLDASESMRGYVSDEEHPIPITPFQQLLQTLLVERLSDVGLTPRLRTFGAELNPTPLPLRDLRDYVQKRSKYSEGQSDIAAILEEAGRNPASLSVIITDNAQDLGYAKEGKDQRAAGFDRSAIARTVTESLAKGDFGVWLLGSQSRFEGTYFSLMLKLRPGGANTNYPVEMAGGKERPFYCWVISRDWEKGRRLVLDLQAELERFAGTDLDGRPRVHAIELFPGIKPVLALEEPNEEELTPRTRLNAGASSAPLIDVFRVRSWTSDAARPGLSSAELVFESPRTSEILFLLKTRMTLPETREASHLGLPLSAWEVAPQGALELGARLSEKVQRFAPPGQREASSSGSVDYWELAVPYDRLTSMSEDQWGMAVPFSLLARQLPSNHWLREWSTLDDTTAEVLNGKTIYLHDVSQAILARTVGRERKSGCAALRLRRS